MNTHEADKITPKMVLQAKCFGNCNKFEFTLKKNSSILSSLLLTRVTFSAVMSVLKLLNYDFCWPKTTSQAKSADSIVRTNSLLRYTDHIDSKDVQEAVQRHLLCVVFPRFHNTNIWTSSKNGQYENYHTPDSLGLLFKMFLFVIHHDLRDATNEKILLVSIDISSKVSMRSRRYYKMGDPSK